MRMMRWGAVLLVAAALGLGPTRFARADEYPSKPITMIVPFPAGGGNDILARLVASKLTAALGQQVIVDNRGGANGVIALRAAAHAPPDGYTIIFVNSSNTSITPALNPHVGYDVHKDFAPIGLLASTSIGIIAHPSFPAKSVAELIAFARREPGKLNIGTSAPGSGSQLAAELFRARADVDVILVPYKGTAALANDVLGGHIPLIFSVVAPSLGNIRAGRLRLLAMTGTERTAALPEIPTVAESGLPGFEAVLRYGLLAPAGTPRPIIERLNRELRILVADDDVKARIAREAGHPLASTPEQHAAEIVREDGIWGPLIRKLDLKVE